MNLMSLINQLKASSYVQRSSADGQSANEKCQRVTVAWSSSDQQVDSARSGRSELFLKNRNIATIQSDRLFILSIISWRLVFGGETHLNHRVPWKPASLCARLFAGTGRCFALARRALDLAVKPVLLNARHSKNIRFAEANARLVAERKVYTGPKAIREKRKPSTVVGRYGDEMASVRRFYRFLSHLLGGQRELVTSRPGRPADAIRLVDEQKLQVPPPAQIVRVDVRRVRPSLRLDHDPFLDRGLVREGDLKLNVEQTSDPQHDAHR